MLDDHAFRALMARVGNFYITDKAMKRAQDKIETLVSAGEADLRERNEYVAAVRRYFSGFEREARVHLRNLDKRLEQTNQVHFNLTAERAVAVRRIEATANILCDLQSMPVSESAS
ncbi:MAG: hypothetical protein M3Y18_09795 [Candidatus Eremiobacteraeota bacterium]|nr:hypothetical protein [Candidatus Eremiobacteraeota bacterium]